MRSRSTAARAPAIADLVARAAVCTAPLLALIIFRVVTTPSPSHLVILGRSLDPGCIVRRLLHLPCPACGISRSVVYTLHGDLVSAVEVNGAGPIAVLGAAILALGCLVVGARWLAGRMPLSSTRRFVTLAPSVYAALLLAALLGQWAIRVAAM